MLGTFHTVMAYFACQGVRSQITGNFLEMVGIKRKEDSMQEMQAPCIRKDSDDQQKIMNQETLKRFKGESDDKTLYCLTAGKVHHYQTFSVLNDINFYSL